MKNWRILIGVFTFIFAIISYRITTSSAESSSEIRFHDIEWGTSYTDAMSLLQDAGITWLSGGNSTVTTIDELVKGDNSYPFDWGCIYHCVNYPFSKSNPTKVAGYKLSYADLFFLFLPDDQGNLKRTEDNTALYAARYTFFLKGKGYNADEVFLDLKMKLTELYGSVFSTEESMISKRVKWYGESQTGVALYYNSYFEQIYITYYQDTVDEQLAYAKEYETALHEEQSKPTEAPTPDLSGL